MAASPFEEFEVQLQNTLNHFYDPFYTADERIFKVLGIDPMQGMDAVCRAIRMHIEHMKPEAEIPFDTPSRRFFEILNSRYLASASQDEVAFRLNMTSRNLRRLQPRSVYALAQRIWNANQGNAQPSKHHAESSAHPHSPDQLPILRELEVLQRNSPDAVADLSESLGRVQEISRAAFSDQRISLEIVKPELQVSIPVHPSVFDQVLLFTIEQMAKENKEGHIHISSSLIGKNVEIDIVSSYDQSGLPYSTNPMISEMLNLVGGKQTIEHDPQQLKITFTFPAVSNIPILLVDDNPNFAYLFRRFIKRTRYVVHTIREGSHLPQALAEFHPEIIILDVLLPDVDGWKLLIDLQNPLVGQSIPVIICSALGQKDLALSLGAKAYIPKPVSREEFLRVLDSVIQSQVI
jgi:CheY-like chemotaxis protein